MRSGVLLGKEVNRGFEFLDLITTNGSGKSTGYCSATYDTQLGQISINILEVSKEFRGCGYCNSLIHGLLKYRAILERAFRRRHGVVTEIPVIARFDERNHQLLYLADKFNFERNPAGTVYKNYKYDDHEIDYFSKYGAIGFDVIQSNDRVFITDKFSRIICTASFFAYFRDSDNIFDIFEGQHTSQNPKKVRILCIDDIKFVDINCQYILSKTLNDYAIGYYVEAFMRLIQHLEAYALSDNIHDITIFNGTSKRCIADETYNDILYPLGYRYKTKHRGFIKTL